MSTVLGVFYSDLLADVEATILYAIKAGARPVNHPYDPMQRSPGKSGEIVAHSVNGRDAERTFALGDRETFLVLW
jgi:hypothetical protein